MARLPAEIIRAKRDGHELDPAAIEDFAQGLADARWSDAQVGAFAMAVCLRGMTRAETVTLTRAMTRSGEVIDWASARLPGPVVDKHSTGGIGDKVSLMLAPIVAACGGVVPMVSGRGLGHTGGTLDKLESLPGYRVSPSRSTLLRALREAGCAIVGAGPTLAPADRRLYAIRDVTATVESVPLITASILSKKLAAGVQALVLDVKTGNGAFTPTLDEARALARSLVDVAVDAGVPTEALITDMSQPLGRCAGNALELREAIDFLRGDRPERRLVEVTLALAARLLGLAGLARDEADAHAQCRRALESGAAAERFARMVHALGGPAGVLDARGRRGAAAPFQADVPAPRAGRVGRIDTRGIGLAIVRLGGGRTRPGDAIDHRVGLSELVGSGERVAAGQPLGRVHAASAAAAREAVRGVQACFAIDEAGAGPEPAPMVLERVRASAA
jgi:thymidine phosphorylase